MTNHFLEPNTLFLTDSYKPSHWAQLPPESEDLEEYIESRGGVFPETVFCMMQPHLELLTKPITMEDVEEADQFVTEHIGPGVFNRAGFEYIVREHDGYLPLEVYAVPEGTVVPTGNLLVKVRATDPKCIWLVGYMETFLLRAAWYGTTVATLSYTVKKTIKKYLEKTGDPSLLPFKFHDFGARGVSSHESACLGGAAHLVNFQGSDNLEAIRFARRAYRTKAMVGFSIVASEHSTMTSWGGRQGEPVAMKNLLDKFLRKGSMVACVSDSYDIYNAIIQHWGTTLRKQIVESGGTLVIRPDSGDPVEVTLRCVELLAEKFGCSTNEKGYRVLHPAVRLIQGDGIDHIMVEKILANFAKNGWSADNIAFGCGGGLLQKVNRDTQKFAMKCSAIKVAGEWRDVFKDPITDPGKKSKRGQLTLVQHKSGEYATMTETQAKTLINFGEATCPLELVYRNGRMEKLYTFEELRANAEKGLVDYVAV